MFPGREHRRDSDSGRDFVRERSGDSGFRLCGLGRDRSGREEFQRFREAKRLLRNQSDPHADGLCGGWRSHRGNRDGEWPSQTLIAVLIALLIGAMLSCQRGTGSPEVQFESAKGAFIHGDLEKAQADAKEAYLRFRSKQPDWAWKFKILEARIAVWRGLYPDALAILGPDAESLQQPELAISALSVLGVVNAYEHNFVEAERLLTKGAASCISFVAPSCGELLQSRGLLASQQGKSEAAEVLYQQCLSFARTHSDTFLESSALLNLGAEELAQDHFDKAIDFSEAAQRIARIEKASIIDLATQANVGWAHYRLGDHERALDLLLDAEKKAAQHGDWSDQENELTDMGYIYMERRQFDKANQSFLRALDLATKIKSTEDAYNALRVLARLALQTGEPDTASAYA